MTGGGALSHIVLYVFDYERMKDFYTQVLGFHLSDAGQARGADICFLTLDPDLDHHQLALASGRTGEPDAKVFNHAAFRVPALADLRGRYEALTAAPDAREIEPINHASWVSIYFRDPEYNRIEFFADTPWYVNQPIVDPLDMTLSDAEILRVTEETYRSYPGFQPMSEWKAGAATRLEKESV